jgi:23S rRNA pseudouridine1911/1915/1917 synthase
MSEQNISVDFTVDETEAGQRLDAWLVARIDGVSRSQIGRAIEAGRVTRNGEPPAKAGVKVRADDQIHFEHEPVRSVLPIAQDLPLGVIYLDEWLAVVNKPPAMVVHPSAGHPDGTMVNALLHHVGRLSEGSQQERPGIVHRLDKDTTGLLVVARDAVTHRALSEALARREVRRSYITVALGRRMEGQGTIETLYGRHPRERLKMSGQVAVGKRACTHWRVLAQSQALVLLEVRLDTGRTHQIRVHLSEAGHPVVGDELYGRQPPRGGGGRLAFEHGAVRKMPRQALHAAVLAFKHPVTGEDCRFSAPLPDDMTRLIERVFEEEGSRVVDLVLRGGASDSAAGQS